MVKLSKLKFFIKKTIVNISMHFGKKIRILSIEDSLKLVYEKKISIARFGDGEFDIINGGQEGYQSSNKVLAEKLKYVLENPIKTCLIGIPDTISYYNNLTKESEEYWINYMFKWRKLYVSHLDENITYISANITRPYLRYKDKSVCSYYFKMLKKIWDNKDLLIVEGSKTRLGVGNDLFNNSKSIKRILCPPENSFDKYSQIFDAIKKHGKNKLILLALGPTATILAYELSKYNYTALDIGHIDIEYEWFKAGTNKRIAIKNKYTNETKGGNIVEEINDKKYENEIIEIIQ